MFGYYGSLYIAPTSEDKAGTPFNFSHRAIIPGIDTLAMSINGTLLYAGGDGSVMALRVADGLPIGRAIFYPECQDGDVGFSGPPVISVSPDGRVWAPWCNSSVMVYDTNLNWLLTINLPGSPTAPPGAPVFRTIAADLKTNSVWSCIQDDSALMQYDVSGKLLNTLSVNMSVTDFKIDPTDNSFWVLDTTKASGCIISHWAANGTMLALFDALDPNDAYLGIAIDHVHSRIIATVSPQDVPGGVLRALDLKTGELLDTFVFDSSNYNPADVLLSFDSQIAYMTSALTSTIFVFNLTLDQDSAKPKLLSSF